MMVLNKKNFSVFYFGKNSYHFRSLVSPPVKFVLETVNCFELFFIEQTLAEIFGNRISVNFTSFQSVVNFSMYCSFVNARLHKIVH